MADAFIDQVADVGSEDEDEEFDEETGEPVGGKQRTNGVRDEEDSSEEDDDDDEDEARKVHIIISPTHAPS